MDVMALGFQKFETPFANGEIILEHGIAFRRCSEWNLRKRRPIEMEHNNTEYNVIEMEAFALAKVCKRRKKLPFCVLNIFLMGQMETQ